MTRSEAAKKGWLTRRDPDEVRLAREAFKLRVEGISYTEIAARQGVGRDKARRRVWEGRHGGVL